MFLPLRLNRVNDLFGGRDSSAGNPRGGGRATISVSGRQTIMMSGAQFHMEMKLDGAYHALLKNLLNKKIPMNMAKDLSDMISDMLLKEVQEARSETRHIETVLNRLETHLKQFKSVGPAGMIIKTPALEAMSQDIKALHGWVYSLYETEISILNVFSPKKAQEVNAKVAQKMQQQLNSEKMSAVVNRFVAMANGG